ncbi:Lrp/AsnC family transcriptional regulator [Streptomyces sp. NPDC006465]|uniref:Lrp/AsnC family transcriptional regulator n=1 Tax=Streptomyces sp. NPDC006465 TaxID=3157174 RepID=UPI0033BD383F
MLSPVGAGKRWLPLRHPSRCPGAACRDLFGVQSDGTRKLVLERGGAIRGYRAVVDPAAVGLDFETLVFATLRWEDPDTVTAFEEAVTAIPHVIQAQRLFGEPDYLLRIATTDLVAYQQLYDQQLARLPGVQRLTSTLVMKNVIDDRPLPELQ